MRLRPRPRDLDSAITVVVFTVPSNRLAAMDVAMGLWVSRAGKKTSLSSPLTQDGGETCELTKASYTALTGNDSKDSLVIIERSGDGVLSTFSKEFLDPMAVANERHLRLADADEKAGNADPSRSWLCPTIRTRACGSTPPNRGRPPTMLCGS